MIQRFVTALIGVALILCTSVFSFAKTPSVDVLVGIGQLSGDTTYRIGGNASSNINGTWVQRYPTSELEFPLDVDMVSLNCNVTFGKNWHLIAGLKKNFFDTSAGSAKDSDWGILYNEIDWWKDPNSLDVFSTSDAELDALLLNINLRYRIPVSTHLFFLGGIGYIYQNFDYELKNLDQWYPSRDAYYGYNTGHIIIDGKVGLYEVTYKIPFLEVGAQFNKGKFNAELSLGYSPYANATDIDQHLLRFIEIKGDCDGDALFFSINGSYHFTNQIFITLQFDQTQIKTDGQKNITSYEDIEENGVPEVGKIETEIDSDQRLLLFSVGYNF